MKRTTHFKGHRWTTEELKLLMAMWAEDDPVPAIAEKLNATSAAVLKMVQKLRRQGIPLKRRTKGNVAGRSYKPWTQAEVEYLLRQRASGATLESIGFDLGRTWNAVNAMVQKMRQESVPVAMYGQGKRRLWDVSELKAMAIQMPESQSIEQIPCLDGGVQ